MSIKKRSSIRKAQFYLISAVVIVFVLVGFAVVSNYVYVKTEPQKFYDIADVLKLEGIEVIGYSEYTHNDVESNIDEYLGLFENYLGEHTSENFDLIIVYGNAKTAEVQAVRYSTNSSEGGVSLSLGQTSFLPPIESGRIKKEQALVDVASSNTVNVTLTSGDLSITETLPVLEDNNFVFIMTTSEGFSNYIQSSLKPK